MADLNLTPEANDMSAVVAPAPVAKPVDETDPVKKLNTKIAKSMGERKDNSLMNKKNFLNDWKRNIDIRIGQPIPIFTEGLDLDTDLQSAVNPDWSLTKTKTANLFSQVPTIRGTHENTQYKAAVGPFLKQLNYEFGPKRANVAIAMNECLNDVVNASGIAAAIVTYSARFDDVELPTEDPMLPAPAPAVPQGAPAPVTGQDGQPVLSGAGPGGPGVMSPMPPAAPPVTPVRRPVSDMFSVSRISPKDLLWPSEFVGSDFNNGDFIGHRDRCTKAIAMSDKESGGFELSEDDASAAVLTLQSHDSVTDLRANPDKVVLAEVDMIGYHEMFYWRYRQDPKEKNFKAIWRIVFVDGKTDPVIHEAWSGQQLDVATRKLLGSHKYPIQVLTLTYITDNPVPPSDSAAGRPQVNDMRRSRSQMFQNRARSIPIRWFDVNRIDQDLQANLMRGIVQGMIPTNGPGDRSIGEIARASYPSENIEFDQAAKADLMESWQIGPNQMSTTGGRQTAGEAEIVQQNFTTRIGQERAFVGTFLTNLAEVMCGLLALYSDFPALTPDELKAMTGAWDSKHILHDLMLSIVPDSTVMLDAAQETKRLMGVMNMTVQSGFVNPEPIIARILLLNGLDPAEVMTKPQDKKDQPNISFRFTGKDDMMNPMVVAMLMHAGQFPDQAEIDAAKKVLDGLGQPAGPSGMPPGGPPPPPNGQQPPAHPDWEMAGKVASRSREMGGA